MAVASLTTSDLERGAYLRHEDGKRLFRIADTARDGFLLEDCLTLDCEWWTTRTVLDECYRVTPRAESAA